MDDSNWDLASGLVSRTYAQQGSQALARRRKQVKALLSQRRLPTEGWDDATIELFLQVWRRGLPREGSLCYYGHSVASPALSPVR